MKKVLIWTVAFIITVIAAIYQRVTGPTYPVKVNISINNNTYSSKLIRSTNSTEDCKIELNIPQNVKAELLYKRDKINEDYTALPFAVEDENHQVAYLPKMPAAAKLNYFVKLSEGNINPKLSENSPITIRFKDPVPAWALIPHILFMFLAMLFSNGAGIAALFKTPAYKRYSMEALILLIGGGLILGPIVQHYAFGQAWTGFPMGLDLTDNKTLIALIVWIIAFMINRKKNLYWPTVVAAIVTIVIFSIPHSLMGSELNYESGKVVTGLIRWIF